MDDIKIEAYDPRWPARAEAEIARVRATLPAGLMLRVEHIGSTAVPGLAAKPVIDLMILARTLDDAREQAIPPLEAMGYSYWRANPDPTRLFLVKGLPPAAAQRTHHIHITGDEADLIRHCRFRDHLRVNADDARRYQELKLELAARYRSDREAYTEAKAGFVAEIELKLRGAVNRR